MLLVISGATSCNLSNVGINPGGPLNQNNPAHFFSRLN